jgi:hypothetical protein
MSQPALVVQPTSVPPSVPDDTLLMIVRMCVLSML